MIKIAAPVYKFENPNMPYILVLHKSTKHRSGLGIWQMSFFDQNMIDQPVGDSEFGSLEDAMQYAEEQGYQIVDKVEDPQEIHALFKLKSSVGIVDMFYEDTQAEGKSPKVARDNGQNVQTEDRDALADPTQRGEITQLEDEKVGEDTTNRTQEH